MAQGQSTDMDRIARELSLTTSQVVAVAKLLDEGNTPAFITRFRREASGALNESRILDIKRRLNVQRSLAERKSIILKSIESQGKLTPEVSAAIDQAQTSKQLEDIYLPYKPLKQSLGQIARQRGLEPLATDLFQGTASDADLATRATEYVRVDKGLHSVDDVVKGVSHLIAERFANDVSWRTRCREVIWKTGRMVTRKIEPEEKTTSAADAPAPAPATGAIPPAEATSPSETSPPLPAHQEPAASTSVAPSPEISSQPQVAASPPSAVVGPASEGEVSSEAAAVSGAADATSSYQGQVQPTDAPSNNPSAVGEPRVEDSKKRRRKKKVKTHDPFKDYADFSELLSKLPSHRTLAINRAERAKSIRVRTKVDDELLTELVRSVIPADHAFADFLEKCAQDSLQRLVMPSLEREVRRELTEEAEQHALKVFGRNLRHLLLKPPVRGRRVVAIDPGYRYGCHAAALDEFGNLLGHIVFHVVGNDARRAEGRRKLAELINAQGASMIAIGNGSGCRETEQLVSDLINAELAERNLEYVIVNEAGTNAYASSEIGREELPHCDPAVRSAVSIGRRLLDPLSELVKVDPAHLGIGLYQHDIKAKHLAHELDEVVDSCVNYVGVDVNTASPALLAHVSGLGPLAARRLFEYRLQHGPFRNRQQFKEVAGIGEQTFVQAAGFLRVLNGDNPLDATMLHPESYDDAVKVLQAAGFSPEDLLAPKPIPAASTSIEPAAAVAAAETSTAAPADEAAPTAPAEQPVKSDRRAALREALHHLDRQKLSHELGISPQAVGDIIHALLHAGVDPRERLPGAVFRRGIIKIENLQPQMQLRAQVINVVDFGVFVDIGLGESSLVHISRLSDGFVSDPHLMFAVGDTLDVWVTQVDPQRRRVSLTAVRPGAPKAAPRGRRRREPSPRPVGAKTQAGGAPHDKKPFPRKPKRFEGAKRIQKPRPPRPVTPITQEMVEGKAPMRSFSDLAQFFSKKNEAPKDNQ